MTRIRRKAICSNCGQMKQIKRRGQCAACANYFLQNGVKRPLYLYDRPEICVQCGRLPARYVNPSLCKTCYNYSNRLGEGRPDHLLRNSCANPNCKKPLRKNYRTKGRCITCYSYLISAGHDRSLALTRFVSIEGYRPCANPNCDKPIRENSKRGKYCYNCLRYLKSNGKDRPKRLCPQADPFICQGCGAVAIKRRIAGDYEVWVCAACEYKYIPVRQWETIEKHDNR